MSTIPVCQVAISRWRRVIGSMRMTVSVEYAETDTSFSQISADGYSDSCQTLICKGISSSNDGEYIDPRRETTDDVRLRLLECGTR
jgi:hypothetical protein